MSKNESKSNKIKIILGIISFIVIISVSIFNSILKKGTVITEFDNYYNENNIVLFYEEQNSEELKELDAEYGITDYVSNEEKEFDKVLKATNIVHKLVEKDGIKDTKLDSAYQILKKKDSSKKVSFKDMAIIMRDVINCTGVKSRIGVFRKSDAQFKSDYEYYVIEYWSNEYSKWVMIDFLDQGYFAADKDDTKLSSIEVMNCDLKKTPYVGKTSQKDYKNKLNKFLGSYSLSIENSNSKQRSNCDITYVKEMDAITLKFKDRLPNPSIYTNKTILFEKSPFDQSIKKDEKAYLLVYLSKFTSNSGIISKNEEDAVISAFNQDKTINDFYLRINDGEYEKITGYKEIKITKGATKIELSLDGNNTLSSMTIEKR